MTRVIPPYPITLLMPVCNEVDLIVEVVEEWHREVIQHLAAGSELIFDDCSTDATRELLEQLKAKHPYIAVLDSPRDGFFRSAMRLYRAARHPVVFFTDSDGQYVPAEFWKLTPHLEANDMVHGVKVDRQDPFYRVTASRVFNWLVRARFGLAFEDVNSAFRLVKRPVLDKILARICHMPTLLNSELLLRADREGFKVHSVHVAHRPRKFGKSRGLPLRTFARECLAAYHGLNALAREYARSSQRQCD